MIPKSFRSEIMKKTPDNISGFQCVLPVKTPEIINKYRPLLTSYRSMWSNGSWTCISGIRVVTVAETHHLWEKKEICSISSRSRVLAHRPCPKLEMFCPSVLQLFYGCSKVLMTNHGLSFFFFFLTGWKSELSYPSPWPCESGLTI